MRQPKQKQDAERERLGSKINVPSSRLALLVPVLGIASLLALGAVVVLGVTMLEMLANRVAEPPDNLEDIAHQIEELDQKVRELEYAQEELRKNVLRVTKLANEMYLERPATDLEKQKVMLLRLSPAELLERGLAELNSDKGRPVPYFRVIVDRHMEAPEAQSARLQLGILQVRMGDYAQAVGLLKEYIDRPEAKTDQDKARANYYLAIARDNLGQNEEAVVYYEEALRGFAKTELFRATVHMNLGEAYLRLGRKERAAAQFKILIEEFGGDKRAANMIKHARERLLSLEKEQ